MARIVSQLKKHSMPFHPTGLTGWTGFKNHPENPAHPV